MSKALRRGFLGLLMAVAAVADEPGSHGFPIRVRPDISNSMDTIDHVTIHYTVDRDSTTSTTTIDSHSPADRRFNRMGLMQLASEGPGLIRAEVTGSDGSTVLCQAKVKFMPGSVEIEAVQSGDKRQCVIRPQKVKAMWIFGGSPQTTHPAAPPKTTP